jgi:hypothetical protein
LAASDPSSAWLALQQHRRQAYLQDQLHRQLAKDLGLSPVPDFFYEEDLLAGLTSHLAQRAQQNPRALYQLCYQVDLPEERVAQAYDLRELALLMVEREAQKVLLREQLAGRL